MILSRLRSPPPIPSLQAQVFAGLSSFSPQPPSSFLARLVVPLPHLRPFSSSLPCKRQPLLRLKDAIIPGLVRPNHDTHTPTLDLTIHDEAADEAWAITGPAGEKGGAVKAEVVKLLVGLKTPKQLVTNTGGATTRHPSPHPFLQDLSPSQAIRFVSFSSRLSSTSSSSNSFIDFSTRYGAIREEDRVTVFEWIMNEMGIQTGLIARMNLMPDPLMDPREEARRDFEQGVTRLKWESKEVEEKVRRLAKLSQDRIREMAPLLGMHLGSPPLLEIPLIALSNGQTRRARILAALCVGCQLLVLEEPFTGLDPPTRTSLGQLLQDLHSRRTPRVVCVLREQDELPSFLTHVLSIGEEGQVLFNGPLPTPRPLTAAQLVPLDRTNASEHKGGYELCLSQSTQGIGRGDTSAPAIVEMNNVTIVQQGKTILDRISLSLPPGSRTILVGDNGSGKTTLLSLLLGSHPQSYSFTRDSLSLFGKARDETSNATPLLRRRMGHLSPELINSFPRRALEVGGMNVLQVIGSGYEGVYTRRDLTEEQTDRVKSLVGRFQGVLTSSSRRSTLSLGNKQEGVPVNADDDGDDDGLQRFLSLPLQALTPGSQTLILFLRAIVHRPSLLILDEPFQGMSSKQVAAVRRFLDGDPPMPRRRSSFNSEFDGQSVVERGEKKEEEEKRKDLEWVRDRLAFVLVSHLEEEWPRSAGRLIRLSQGKIVESF